MRLQTNRLPMMKKNKRRPDSWRRMRWLSKYAIANGKISFLEVIAWVNAIFYHLILKNLSRTWACSLKSHRQLWPKQLFRILAMQLIHKRKLQLTQNNSTTTPYTWVPPYPTSQIFSIPNLSFQWPIRYSLPCFILAFFKRQLPFKLEVQQFYRKTIFLSFKRLYSYHDMDIHSSGYSWISMI